MTTRFPTTTHTAGTTYSRAGLYKLPAGDWSAVATVKTGSGTLVQALDVNLAALGSPDVDGNTPADRSELMQIMRANGVWKPVFLSLMPAASSAAAEQDHMVWGKRKSSPISHPFFENYSHEMTLESW